MFSTYVAKNWIFVLLAFLQAGVAVEVYELREDIGLLQGVEQQHNRDIVEMQKARLVVRDGPQPKELTKVARRIELKK
jgi:hypothetical protein